MIHSRILVIAAHPDDDVLGCGGSIAKFASEGSSVKIAFLADGVSARNPGEVDSAELSARRAACEKACGILGVSKPYYGMFPDNQMDTISLLSITQKIEALIESFKPSLIFTHHSGDVNVDHQLVHHAVVTACRPQRGHSVRSILFFEVSSSTEWQVPNSAAAFAPNWFVDISEFLERKLEAMAAYEQELRDWPHPRSLKGIEALANWRGATIGVDAAEAFILGRHLQ